MTLIPSSAVRILSGCRLKPDYEHSIWWVSRGNQYKYFHDKTKHHLTSMQYTRTNGNSIKVSIPVEDLMDCNYMIITNVGHENKDYYAFITNIEYVSESTTRIDYEIDLIQTWYFECELMPCMVEREHSVEDVIGENLMPEPLPVGEYVDHRGTPAGESFRENVIIVTTCFTVTDEGKLQSVGDKLVGKTYSALHYHAFPCTQKGLEGIAALITFDTLNPIDNVIGVFMAPKFCYEQGRTVVEMPKVYDPFGNHVVRNKKLYTYPYNFLRVTAGDCGYKDFQYEKFPAGDTVSFYLQGDLSTEPAILLTGVDYKVQETMTGYNQDINDALVLKGYPQCPWAGDMFIAYFSQVAASTLNKFSGLNIGGSNQAPLPNNFETGLSVVRPSMNDRLDHSSLFGGVVEGAGDRVTRHLTGAFFNHTGAATVRNTSSGNILFNLDRHQFEFINKRVTPEYAEVIDDYFDRFGYATNKIKVPNRTSRPQWNYVKTTDCQINASLPSDIVLAIQNIYNKGITFWCWGDNVGNYSLDNRPK